MQRFVYSEVVVEDGTYVVIYDQVLVTWNGERRGRRLPGVCWRFAYVVRWVEVPVRLSLSLPGGARGEARRLGVAQLTSIEH